MAFTKRYGTPTRSVHSSNKYTPKSDIEDSSTKNIIQIITKILCAAQSSKYLQELRNDLFHHSKKRLDVSQKDLEDLLRQFPNNFSIKYDPRHGVIVMATTNLKLCETYGANKGYCNLPLCDGLHVCMFYLLSNSCRFTGKSCDYGHDLTSGHNKRLLKDHFLHKLTVLELKYLFQNVENRSTATLPKVCKFYNISSGCRNDRIGKPCPRMHICKYFILDDCKFGLRCKRNHDIVHPQVKRVLVKHGVNVTRSPQVILSELQTAGVGDADCESLSGYSAASDRGYAAPFGGRNYGTTFSPVPRWRSSSLDRISARRPQSFFKTPLYLHDNLSDNFDSDDGVDAIVDSDLSNEIDEEGEAMSYCMIPCGIGNERSTIENSAVMESLDIRIYNLRGLCLFGVACGKQHKQMPYQWQYQKISDKSWVDFDQQQNIDIELNYCDVHKTACYIELRSQGIAMLDFEKQQAHFSNQQDLKIRRLSTASSTLEIFQPLATDWKWYISTQEGEWIEYGFQKVPGGKPVMDSTDLEKTFQENPHGIVRLIILGTEYLIDFLQMRHTNLLTNRSNQLRRRPVFVHVKEFDTRKKRKSDPKSKNELKKVEALFGLSMSSSYIVSVERVENVELWMKYKSKKEEMKRKMTAENVNERRLFYGTHHEYIDAICRQGFDFSGTSVGTKFSKGSYFSKSSFFADINTDKFKEMFLVLALDPHKLYDACDDDVRSPNIYVINAFGQVYPEYIIKYEP